MTNETMQEVEEQDGFIMHPTVDFCFKELMENAKVRQGLIAAILGKDPEEIQDTELLPTILRKEFVDDKYGILDVRVLLKSGEQLDLEMQVVAFEFWFQRSVYYLSKMVTDQMKEGDSYDKIQPCIQVGILDFNFLEDDECYHAGMFCDRKTGEVLTNLLQIHILELKKLPPESQDETGIIKWMRFMSGKSRKDFAKMAEQNEYINEAYKCLEKMSADERKRREYEERQKLLWDRNSFLKSAKIIGMREGREVGIKEGREVGIKEGREVGIKEGRKVGIKEGREEGIKQGRQEGIQQGIEQGIEQGIQDKLISLVVKKMKKGMSAGAIAELLEENPVFVEKIYNAANECAPEYDMKKISEILKK